MASRMNKSASITGRTRVRKPDAHGTAVAEAYESGLAAWALANGYVCPDGSPAIHSAKQRRAVERAKAMAEEAALTSVTATSKCGKSRAIVTRQPDGRWALGFTDGAPGRAFTPAAVYFSLAAAKRGAEAWIGGHFAGCQWSNN